MNERQSARSLPLEGEVAEAREGWDCHRHSAPTHPTLPSRGGCDVRHVADLPHDSGIKHVQGAAQYIDDIREPEGTLHVAIGQSPKARGRLISLDVSAVRAVPGVVAVLTAADIPGKNDVSPAFGDDPLFVDTEISFHRSGALRRRRDGPRHRAPRGQEGA